MPYINMCVSDIGLAVKYTCFHVAVRARLRCLTKRQCIIGHHGFVLEAAA